MTDEKIGQYLKEGGELFIVTNMDFIRDGGTTIIFTTRGNYYISKGKFLYMDYPMNDDNILRQSLHREYLLSRVQDYITNLSRNVDRFQDRLNTLNK